MPSFQGFSMMARTLLRAHRAAEAQALRAPAEPWWHSLTCVCDQCLDVDALIGEHFGQVGDRPLFAAPVPQRGPEASYFIYDEEPDGRA